MAVHDANPDPYTDSSIDTRYIKNYTDSKGRYTLEVNAKGKIQIQMGAYEENPRDASHSKWNVIEKEDAKAIPVIIYTPSKKSP